MTRACITLVALAVLACVSQRERRQSVSATDHTGITAQRDSLWYGRQTDRWIIELLELERWRTAPLVPCTAPSTGPTAPTGRNTVRPAEVTHPVETAYERIRLLSLRRDSGSSRAGQTAQTGSTFRQKTERKAESAVGKSRPPNSLMGWILPVVVLVYVGYRVARKVYR